jgi:L-ribulose-5-phosphate 4-epimerase
MRKSTMGKYDEYRREVLEVSQMLSENGYFGTRSGSAGNVSVLIEGEEAVAVTPHGKKYADMTIEDICIVDLDLARIDGTLDPSVEAPLHVAVYKNRRDVNAVVHSHQIYASILSLPFSMKSPSPSARWSMSFPTAYPAARSSSRTWSASSTIAATATCFRTTARCA